MATQRKKRSGSGGSEAGAKEALRSPKPRRRRSKPAAGGRARRWLRLAVVVPVIALAATPVLLVLWVVTLAFVPVPPTPYMLAESRRLGGIRAEWTRLDDIAPVMARAVVAAEDANFCLHWGFDMAALRQAIEEGGNRGASTISQQTVKNVFLWQGRSYVRKALEALITPLVEAVWSKRRIVEVYLNVAEFDEGVFGVGAAAPHYFGVTPDKLTTTQAARLAAILPSPKSRSASKPGAFVRARAQSIAEGAATIEADGRAACFER